MKGEVHHRWQVRMDKLDSIKREEKVRPRWDLGWGKEKSRSTIEKDDPGRYLGVLFHDPSAGKFSHLASPSSIQSCGTIFSLYL